MDNIKEAFSKVKEDIQSMEYEIDFIKTDLEKTRKQMAELGILLKNFIEKSNSNRQTDTSTHHNPIPTISTHNSTHKSFLKPLKPENLGISIGNQGVPTDKQTNRQTHQQTEKSSHNLSKPDLNQNFNFDSKKENSIENAAKILDSLDSLKKEIRLKFKKLTEQEMLVFSTLYQISEAETSTNYRKIANKLGLTESSIRDYVGRLIKKGIPVVKTRINNKNIQLSISQNLKKVATLPTIMKLREL